MQTTRLRLIKVTTVHSVTIKFHKISAATARYTEIKGHRFLDGTQIGVGSLELKGDPTQADLDILVQAWNDSSMRLKKGYLIDSAEISARHTTCEYIKDTAPLAMGKPMDSILDVASTIEEQLEEAKKHQRKQDFDDVWRDAR